MGEQLYSGNINRSAPARARAGRFDYDICQTDDTVEVVIDFGDGWCLSRVDKMTKEVYHAIDDEFIVDKIKYGYPEIWLAMGKVRICNIPLPQIIRDIKARELMED